MRGREHDRHELLRLLDGKTTSEFIAAADAPRRTALDALKQFRQAGYVRSEQYGRTVMNHLTAEGRSRLDGYRKIMNLPPVKETGANSGAKQIIVDDIDKNERIERILNRYSSHCRTEQRTYFEGQTPEDIRNKFENYIKESEDNDENSFY